MSSQDPQPLPVPLLWEQARVTQATHLRSIYPLLPQWKSNPLIPIVFSVFGPTGKASLTFRKMPLCVALCRRSCVVRMYSSPSSESLCLSALNKPFNHTKTRSEPNRNFLKTCKTMWRLERLFTETLTLYLVFQYVTFL